MSPTANQELFRRILYRTLIVPLLLLAAFLISLPYIGKSVTSISTWEHHSLEILAASHEADKLMVDSESGLRGFQLTGAEVFLEPSQWAENRLPTQWAQLNELVKDNSEQIRNLERVHNAYERWKEFSVDAIARRKKGDPGDVDFNLVGKTRMDAIRHELQAFENQEEALLAKRRAAIEPTRQAAHSIRYALGGVIFIITALWARRQLRFLAGTYERSLTELKEQKEWFRVTLTSIGDAVIVTNRDGKVDFINPEAERLTGWEWKDAKNKSLRSIFRIINEQTRHPADDPVEKVFREKRVVGLANHTIVISKSGVEWPIEDSASPIYGQNGEISGVVLVFHDATETRRAEKLLKNYSADLEKKVLERTLELHRTINDLQAFSYSVSHDLRSPLRAMQAYAQVLLEDYGETLDDTGRDYLNRLTNSAKRLDLLIQDILTYSRLGSEQPSIHTVDLNRLVLEIIDQYPSLKESSASIEVRQPLAPVVGHESALTQVISNLLVNALKFKVSDRPVRIVISTEMKEKAIVLSVADNGIGIRAEDQERIFKMFEQVDGKAYSGTGIGLAIVKRAVEQMHGTINVDSKLGEGSRFNVELLKPRAT